MDPWDEYNARRSKRQCYDRGWTLPADWKAWPYPGWPGIKMFSIESGPLREEASRGGALIGTPLRALLAWWSERRTAVPLSARAAIYFSEYALPERVSIDVRAHSAYDTSTCFLSPGSCPSSFAGPRPTTLDDASANAKSSKIAG